MNNDLMADSRGQHVSVPEFRDNGEDSAGFGVSRPPKKTDQSDRECIYDGRLSTPKVEFMLDTIAKCDPRNTNDKGGFGKVYCYKDKHPKLGIPVAIKEVIIEETSQKLKKMSTINERLASRTLHYAIVPLLAMTEDKSKRAFYFLSPYLENGDLFQTLKDDTEKINAGRINDVTLPKQRRLKILYHIGSALDFLHTPVKDIRGPIIHMDVKSLNIVLDADFNARLIDFGLAREMHETESGIPVTKTEIGGTDGYFPTRGYSVLTKYEDYHNFGVVGLECLTGLPPHNPNDRDGDLRVQHVEKLRDKIQDIWLADDDIGPDAEKVLQMFIKCIASPTKKNISSAEICRNLQVLLQHQRISSWDRQHKFENKCEICMINPAVTDDVLTHEENCSCNINVCIACIRNSYVNNIKCHSCEADIFPTIGHFWAALLIIGNDVKNSQLAQVFKKDIMDVHRIIVSMCPRIIGIRPENVFVVEAETPGLKANLKGKVECVVEKLSKMKSIQTILVYYSGHSDENGFDLENDEVYITEEEFSTHMKRIVTSENAATDSLEFRNAISRAVSPKRFICFLDCCYPPNLTVLQDQHVCVIQVNACRSKRQSMLETNGSVFTQFFIQALTQSAYGKECIDKQCKCTPINGDFITVGKLVAYMRSHMKKYLARRNIETYNAPEKHEMCVTDHDEKIAFNIDFLEQLEFRFKDPDSSSDMMRKKIKPNFISDMQGLSRILFATFIEQKFPALAFDETDLDVYEYCICVEIDKGPKQTEELDTIEKVMKAWNSRRDLAVSLRCLSNIRRGMVLLNLHPVKIQQFLENTSITSLEIYSVPTNSTFTIPFAAISVLKREIKQKKQEGELKCFRDHLSDIMNACKLEENEDALVSIILPNTDDRRKLPFVCYKVTITEKWQQETSTEGGQSINTENGGKDETVPKQVYNTLTTHLRYETSTNIEMNTPFVNQTPTDQIGEQKIYGKEASTEGGQSINTENGGKDETVPKQVYNTLTTHLRYETSTNNEMNTPFVNQTPTDQIGAQKIYGKDEMEYEPYADDLYKKAFQDGIVEDSSIRVNVMGIFGQGKTSLITRLLRKSIESIDSTNGIDIARYKCLRDESGNVTYVENLDLSDIVNRIAAVAKSLSARHHFIQDNTLDIFSERTKAKPLSARRHFIQDNTLDIFSERTKAFDIWDFSGEPVFYATHTLFYSRKAIYLLVFNLCCGLTDIVPNDDEECRANMGQRTMEYYIRFWVNSIHSLVGNKDGTEPIIILVGTHLDKLKGDADEKQRQADRYLDDVRALFERKQVYSHILPRAFAVDNTSVEDREFAALTEEILVAGTKLAKSTKVPAKWIQLEKSLFQCREQKIIEFAAVIEMDKMNEFCLGTSEQIKLFLKHHHDRGAVFFFDEEPISNYVCLDPQFLINAFKCLITADRFVTNMSDVFEAWQALKTKGRLEPTLINKLWTNAEDKLLMAHRDTILWFLQKHHILSQAMKFDEKKNIKVELGWYIVPSLLKDVSQQAEISDFLRGKNQTIVQFVISFDNSAVVPTVYHRLVAAVLGEWSIIVFKEKSLLFKDLSIVQIDLDHAGQIKLNDKHIHFSVLNRNPPRNVKRKVADKFRRFGESVLKYEFGKFKGVTEYRTLPYDQGYACNHSSHGVSGGKIIKPFGQEFTISSLTCPDLEPHSIDTALAMSEWFQGKEDLVQYLSDQTLNSLSLLIGKGWRTLGLALGISNAMIEQIERESDYTAMRVYRMLRCWRDSFPDKAYLGFLIKELKNLPIITVDWDGIRNIADKLKQSPGSAQ